MKLFRPCGTEICGGAISPAINGWAIVGDDYATPVRDSFNDVRLHHCQIGETYIKIGNGRDYADVPPISNNYHGTRDHQMQVEVKIFPVV